MKSYFLEYIDYDDQPVSIALDKIAYFHPHESDPNHMTFISYANSYSVVKVPYEKVSYDINIINAID